MKTKTNTRTLRAAMVISTLALFFVAACSNSTNDNNTEKGTMPYNSNSETFEPDSGGDTTEYNNSTTGTTHSTTSSTTNSRTTHGSDDTLKYNKNKD